MTITQTTYGKLPAIQINSPDGSQAIVTLYGAHLVSWKASDGKERIFVSSKSSLDGSRAIRGGVPVIFPQFAERGQGMRHGFARVSQWREGASRTAGDRSYCEFELAPTDLAPEVAAAWPHGFALTLRVTLDARSLQMSLDVRNTGAGRFEFAAALHTYYLLDEGVAPKVSGLEAMPLVVTGKVDRIYRHIGAPIGMDGLKLEQAAFRDAVLWNPGEADAAKLEDLGEGEWKRFVCIEPATVDPMPLLPGETWSARHTITA
jgi:glucose-6-phosphate 1-epimerase